MFRRLRLCDPGLSSRRPLRPSSLPWSFIFAPLPLLVPALSWKRESLRPLLLLKTCLIDGVIAFLVLSLLLKPTPKWFLPLPVLFPFDVEHLTFCSLRAFFCGGDGACVCSSRKPFSWWNQPRQIF